MTLATDSPARAAVEQPLPGSTPIRGRPFFHRVESLRGVGAMAIAGFHISGAPLHDVVLFTNVPWNRITTFQGALSRIGLALLPGHAALMIFFVISGFVLRGSLEHGPQTAPAATAKFVLARLFRIYPIVFFVVILSAVLSQGRFAPHGPVNRALTAPLLLANLFLFDVSMNTTLWALQLELLMVPIFLLLYFIERKRGPYTLLAVALAATALAYWPSWAVWRPLSTNLFPFVLGMVIPTLGRRFAAHWSKRGAIRWTMGAAAVLFLTGPCLGVYSRSSAVLEAYAAAALVSLAAYRLDVSVLKWLDARPLRLLGLASGSYYVLHMTTIAAALAVAETIIPQAWSADYPALVGFLVIPVWLVAVAPLALCGFYLIEAPGVALGRRVARCCGLGGRAAQAPVDNPTARRVAA